MLSSNVSEKCTKRVVVAQMDRAKEVLVLLLDSCTVISHVSLQNSIILGGLVCEWESKSDGDGDGDSDSDSDGDGDGDGGGTESTGHRTLDTGKQGGGCVN